MAEGGYTRIQALLGTVIRKIFLIRKKEIKEGSSVTVHYFYIISIRPREMTMNYP